MVQKSPVESTSVQCMRRAKNLCANAIAYLGTKDASAECKLNLKVRKSLKAYGKLTTYFGEHIR